MPTEPTPERKTYHCGTLTYTKAGLVALFVWLLWGDFCFSVMEYVMPMSLPLKLKELNCPDWLMAMIWSTIPSILNMTVCPWVSFKSDRYRSRWGRRIPYMLWTIPFVCLGLVGLGYCDEVGAWLRSHVSVMATMSPATVVIIWIAFAMAVYQFFNMFVDSVFWYLFNDVVPAEYLARFCGQFRIVGNVVQLAYMWFIYKYALTNMREILLWSSVLYFVGFTLTCVMVKEGEYPPVEGEDDKSAKGLRGIGTFLKQGFCHKWYWVVFIWTSISAISAGIGTFGVFFTRDEMGLTLDQIGKISAITTFASLAAMSVVTIFVDRWHPMRVQTYVCIFSAFAAFGSWVWIWITLPPIYYFWLSLGTGLIGVFYSTLSGICGWPLLMRVFPKSRYGQFCSTAALVRSACQLLGGMGAGFYISGMKWFRVGAEHGVNFVYRLNFLWPCAFGLVTAFMGIWAYRYWHQLGGDMHYKAPAPWSPEQFEEVDIVPTTGAHERWLNWSLRFLSIVMWSPLLALPVLMWWMQQRGAAVAFRGYAMYVAPCTLVTCIAWLLVARSIRGDMARALRNEPPRYGIPHHGLLLVVAIKYLLTVPIWVAQVVVTVRMGMDRESVIFGIGNVTTNFLLIIAVILVCWMSVDIPSRWRRPRPARACGTAEPLCG